MPGIRRLYPYMMTRGGPVYLYSTDPLQWDPVTTAQTLAHEHRYVGNYGAYSVAQHAVCVARVTAQLLALDERWRGSTTPLEKRRLTLAALHHDDAESVTGDVPSPVKLEIKSDSSNFRSILDSLDAGLEARYNLEPGDLGHPAVKEADLVVFMAEVRMLVPKNKQHRYTADGALELSYLREFQPSWADVLPWTVNEAVALYLDMHERLIDEH